MRQGETMSYYETGEGLSTTEDWIKATEGMKIYAFDATSITLGLTNPQPPRIPGSGKEHILQVSPDFDAPLDLGT